MNIHTVCRKDNRNNKDRIAIEVRSSSIRKRYEICSGKHLWDYESHKCFPDNIVEETINKKMDQLINEYKPTLVSNREILEYILTNRHEFSRKSNDKLVYQQWLRSNSIELPISDPTVEATIIHLSDINLNCKSPVCIQQRKFIGAYSIDVEKCFYNFCGMDCTATFRSNKMLGDKNSVHKVSPEKMKLANAIRSVKLKEKIKNGLFVPNVTNSWTGLDYEIEYIKNGNTVKHKVRSSWEAFYQLMFPHLEYEKLIVQYNFNGKNKNYIVDFIDKQSKTVYEVKPDKEKSTPTNIAKFEALENWCKQNDYSMYIISDEWFKDNYTKNQHILHNQPMGETLKQKLKQFNED